MTDKHLEYYYKLRKQGALAKYALRSAKTINYFHQMEHHGEVRIRQEYDEYHDIDSIMGDYDCDGFMTKDEAWKEYQRLCDMGIFGIIGEYKTIGGDWEQADSIWGLAGYNNPSSPFENCYVVDIMHETLRAYKANIYRQCA